MIRFLVLVGYYLLMIYLRVSGNLTQYINAHYTYLVHLSMGISAFLAVVQLVKWTKVDKQAQRAAEVEPSHELSRGMKIQSIVLLALPLLVGFLFPTVSLDSAIVQAKGFHFPKSRETTEGADARIQYLKPDTSIYFNKEDYRRLMETLRKKVSGQDELKITADNYLELMEFIYQFPHEFVGKKVTVSGFIYRDSEAKMEKNAAFVFRFGVVHCIADSGVFGLYNEFPGTLSFKNNEWVKVTGMLSTKYVSTFQQTLPYLQVKEAVKENAPKNPYVYRKF